MVRAHQLGTALKELIVETQQGGGDVGTVISNFVDFLESRNLRVMLPAVIAWLERDQKQVLSRGLVIETSHVVDNSTLDAIRAHIGVSEKDFRHHVNADLVGGFRARYKDTMHDGSIRHQLDMLRRMLA